MTKPNIVIFCENHHYDALTLTAEEAVIDKLDKNKWTHSLSEGFLHIRKDENRTPIREVDLRAHYPSNTLPSDTCHSMFFPLKEKFLSYFTSYDFDNNDIKDKLFEEINLCPKLDILHSTLTASELLSIIKKESDVEDGPLEVQRNMEIVQNLEKISIQVRNNHTIGWAGQSHCVDFHQHLKNSNPSLLEKIKFINIKGPCDDNNHTQTFLDELKIYYFSDCTEDPRFVEIFSRLLAIGPISEIMGGNENNIPDLQEENFVNSPHVLNINVSLFNEPGAMLPWQVADLDIFN